MSEPAPEPPATGQGSAPQSQTLDRGLRILEYLAAAGGPRPVMEIARAVGLHRSIAYRLLRTLEDHRFAERDAAGHYGLGLGIAALARGVRSGLQAAARAPLEGLAGELGMTAFLVVRAGNEAVTVASVEPQSSAAHVTYRPGTRHPVDRGAPGLALLMPEPAADGDRRELRRSREAGWASSYGEVIPGLRSVAAPVLGPDRRAAAAVGVVFVGDLDEGRIGRAAAVAAEAVAAALR